MEFELELEKESFSRLSGINRQIKAGADAKKLICEEIQKIWDEEFTTTPIVCTEVVDCEVTNDGSIKAKISLSGCIGNKEKVKC